MRLATGILALMAAASAAQDSDQPTIHFPKLPSFVRDAAEFVPHGWKMIATKTGDLNGDKRPDVAVLMRMNDPANIERDKYYEDDTNPILLAIGFGNADGYTLAASNHNLFPTETAPVHGDDPPSADTLKVEHGVLSLMFGHLRGFDQLRFRWNGKAFALIGYDCTGVAGGSIFGLSANYLTRRARVERGEVGIDKSDFWTVRIRPGNRPTLDRIDWGFDAGTEVDGSPLGC